MSDKKNEGTDFPPLLGPDVQPVAPPKLFVDPSARRDTTPAGGQPPTDGSQPGENAYKE